MILQKGDKNRDVERLQLMLNVVCHSVLIEDGDFGNATQEAIKLFQKQQKLNVTGIVDETTINLLTTIYLNISKVQVGGNIQKYLLKEGQYVAQTSKKVGICLHHTAGWENPNRVKEVWENDDRGRVATHFIIGGESLKGDKQYDGKVIQCFPLENWAYHIATSRMGFSGEHNDTTSAKYIGIEVCNWGMLDFKDGNYVNYIGGIVPKEQVCILETPFRTYKYWHKYTDTQILSLERLINQLIADCNFDISNDFIGEINDNWFELSWNALTHKRVLTTHTNFEYGKFDMFPQPELIEMLKRIYNGHIHNRG